MNTDIANPKTPSLRASMRVCGVPTPPTRNAHTRASSGRLLGIHGKLHAMPTVRGFEDSAAIPELQFVQRRVERFALQDLARSILTEMVERNGKMTYKHQVRNCLRARISKHKGVGLFYNVERQQANFGNLQRCSSVWNCPVCSMTITEGRRNELKKGLNQWAVNGGHVLLVTFTNSHHSGDDLNSLVNGQKKAFVKFWQKRKITEMMKRLGYKGRIVATEVTWGESNGWHPHYHMLFFFDQQVNEQGLQTFLSLEWQDACKKAGLKLPSLEHGVDVRDGTYAAKYVSKWGLEDEITKGHVKKGRNGSLTPFDLLRESISNNQFKGLFRQFADVFKGKQQLVWSKGLKELLKIERLSDEELIEETENASVEVRDLPLEIWDLVLRYKQRSYVLELVELDYQMDTDYLSDFIMELAEKYALEIIDNSSG